MVLPVLQFQNYYLKYGFKDLNNMRSYTVFYQRMLKTLNWAQKEMAEVTNLAGKNGVRCQMRWLVQMYLLVYQLQTSLTE